MQQIFISAYGKVILEKGILYVRNQKPVLTFSQFVSVAFPICMVLRFIAYFFEEDSSKRNVGLILLSIPALVFGIELTRKAYKSIFLQSFSKRIPLRNIISYRLEEDANELEMHLYLKLRSGKERKLTFRKLENQYQALAEQLSVYITNPKFA